MKKVLIVIGLPGSWKTTYVENHLKDYDFFDDYYKYECKSLRKSIYYEQLIKSINTNKGIVVSDIAWTQELKLKEFVNELNTLFISLNIKTNIGFLYFENNPEICKKNVLYRNRSDERVKKEFELIDRFTKNYKVPNWYQWIKIFDTSTLW